MAVHSRHRSSRGQVVPIAALVAILLLAFVALAIDGGRGYLDRRGLQSTADMAALSGAAELGRNFKTDLGGKKARLAAVHEAVYNLPGTSVPGGYTGTADSVGCGNGCLNLSNDYRMDVSTTITHVYVKLYHKLSLTFGVSAGFGPFITPAAEATAINGKVPFAVILFRTACIGAAGNGCGNLTNSGGGTNVLVSASDYPTDTGDGLTNETVCPAPSSIGLNFQNQGNEYAVSPSGGGQFPASPCGNPNIVNVLCTGGTPQSCVSPSIPMIQWPSQLADPLYPEPSASGLPTQADPNVKNGTLACASPGNYTNGITVSKGDLVLLPGIFRIPSGSFNVSNSNGHVWTVDQYASSKGSVPCSLGSVPADPGVIIEMQPQGASGSSNLLSVSGGSFDITASKKYDHIAIYVENSKTGEQNPGPLPTTEFNTTGGGSNVVTFAAGAVYNILGSVYGYSDNMSFEGGSVTANGVGQILAWTVKLTGGGTINQIYDPNNLPSEYGLLK